MNDFRDLLLVGAHEVEEFKRQCTDTTSDAWLDRLAALMKQASIAEGQELEQCVNTIARSIVDSGPMGDCAPSFGKVLDALQRSRKRNARG